jgi:hypothetical protein
VTIHLQLCLLVSYFFRLICKFGANIWRRHHVSLIVNTKCAWTSPVSRSAVGDRGNTTGVSRNGNSHGCDTGLLGGAGRRRRTASTATTLETGCGVCAPTTHAQFTFVRTNGKCRHLRRKRHSRKYPVGYDFPGFRRETCTLRKRMAPASVAPRIPRTRQESINLRNLMRDPKTVYAVRTQ